MIDAMKLVEGLQNNDISAFDAIYWQHHAAVYANVMKLTKDISATEDLVQEVFTALWEKRMQLNADHDVAGWLFVVSYNKTINYLKTHLKTSLAKSKLENTSNLHLEEPGDYDEISSLRWKVIETAFQKLSPQKARVFRLCKLEGKSYEETAHELGISKHTVKEYLSEAMYLIREHVKKHPELSLVSTLFLVTASADILSFLHN
jgi:RNA polymerase sigma-70 factor (ECF subfamily)